MAAIPLSLQLYTLRALTDVDMPATLKSVAKLGYTHVELAGMGNLKSVKDLRKALDDAGLKPSGAHVGLDLLEAGLDRVTEYNRALDNKNVIVPWIPPERRKTEDDWKQIAESVGLIARDAKSRGFEVFYHNHDFEFVRFGNRTALDMISEISGARLELDVYWAAFAGLDPVATIEKYSGRIGMVHLKDMAAGPDRRFAPVGTGTLDFARILAAAAKEKVLFGAVEQDDTYGQDPLKCVEISLRNLEKLQK
jgi:sugar phosphate isomerase/epimerase